MEIINQIDRENKQLALEGKNDAMIHNNEKAETELRLYESCIRKSKKKQDSKQWSYKENGTKMLSMLNDEQTIRMARKKI
jgi:hypothetical protein